jgi:hypothetical protein
MRLQFVAALKRLTSFLRQQEPYTWCQNIFAKSPATFMAGDGHRICIVIVPDVEEPAWVPEYEGEYQPGMLIDPKSFVKVCQAIPTSKRLQPQYRRAYLTSVQGETATAVTAEDSTSISNHEIKLRSGTYPEYERFLPVGPALAVGHIDAKYLADIGQMAVSLGVTHVRISIYPLRQTSRTPQPIVFEANTSDGIYMQVIQAQINTYPKLEIDDETASQMLAVSRE